VKNKLIRYNKGIIFKKTEKKKKEIDFSKITQLGQKSEPVD
jgi:hypothetical protein